MVCKTLDILANSYKYNERCIAGRESTAEADLFHDRRDLVEQAYDRQGESIAYVEPPALSPEEVRP